MKAVLVVLVILVALLLLVGGVVDTYEALLRLQNEGLPEKLDPWTFCGLADEDTDRHCLAGFE